ncbi:hypothetical protein [Pluralibacter gergoviae]|uniref:hypothetical protein n=1 Tax=Pluralibacter gergoviae TaxID=61647 RepID=UPI00090807C3|nr:hypothetical protein [Pluralibacter gergoviae]
MHKKVVILVVLTSPIFRFSLPISKLMAKAIPVRGARFKEARLRELRWAFCISMPLMINSESHPAWQVPH